MANSFITKHALAQALQELMETVPFEKISITQICEKCGMNRKSFYYHFKDKYDLVHWIFDRDFEQITGPEGTVETDENQWDVLEKLCRCFYKNRHFYRKAFQIKGQNSFVEYFRERCRPFLRARLNVLIGEDWTDDFTVNFFEDAFICAMGRWLAEPDSLPPEEFVARTKHLIQNGAAAIYEETESEEEAGEKTEKEKM